MTSSSPRSGLDGGMRSPDRRASCAVADCADPQNLPRPAHREPLDLHQRRAPLVVVPYHARPDEPDRRLGLRGRRHCAPQAVRGVLRAAVRNRSRVEERHGEVWRVIVLSSLL